jgi:hypothetical protein
MNPRDTVNEWLSDLSIVPPVSLDADGVCPLAQGPELIILVEVPDESTVCHLYSPVTPAPDEPLQTGWFQAALELNKFGRALGGTWLSYDARQSVLLLCYNLIIEKTTATEFANALQNVAQAVQAARTFMIPDADTAEELRTQAAMVS